MFGWMVPPCKLPTPQIPATTSAQQILTQSYCAGAQRKRGSLASCPGAGSVSSQPGPQMSQRSIGTFSVRTCKKGYIQWIDRAGGVVPCFSIHLRASWATGKTRLAEKPDLGPGMQPELQEEAGHLERTLGCPFPKILEEKQANESPRSWDSRMRPYR